MYYIFLISQLPIFLFFFFNDTATTEIYTLSLHDALPICSTQYIVEIAQRRRTLDNQLRISEILQAQFLAIMPIDPRSEEHTSELQSQSNLVCRLLLEKKKNN